MDDVTKTVQKKMLQRDADRLRQDISVLQTQKIELQNKIARLTEERNQFLEELEKLEKEAEE